MKLNDDATKHNYIRNNNFAYIFNPKQLKI